MMRRFGEFVLLLFFCYGHALCAQELVISSSLVRPEFAKTPSAGRMMAVAWEYHLRKSPEKMNWAGWAIEAGRISGDPAPVVVGCMIKAWTAFTDARFAEAVYHSNEALSLDDDLEPLSPVRQFLHKEIAQFYVEFGTKKMAAYHFWKCADIAQKRQSKPDESVFKAVSDLAGIYLNNHQTRLAFETYQKAVRLAEQIGNPLYTASAINNLGMAYQHVGLLDSAAQEYRRAFSILPMRTYPDSIFWMSLKDNEALLEVDRGNYALALLHFDSLNVWADMLGDSHRKFRTYQKALTTACKLGAKDRAGTYAQALTDVYNDLSQGTTMWDLPYLESMVKVDSLRGDWPALAQHLGQVNGMRRKELEVEKRKRVEAIEAMVASLTQAFHAESARRDSKSAETAASLKLSWMVVVAVILGALLLLAMTVVLYQRKVAAGREIALKLANQRLEAEKALVEEQTMRLQLAESVSHHQKDLADIAIEMDLRNRITAEWLETLREIARANPTNTQLNQFVQDLERKKNQTKVDRHHPEHIQQINRAFAEKVRLLMPEITKSELELCEFIRLRMHTKEIAALRNITPHAVRVAKYRLKKKLCPDADLDDFLVNL